MDDLAGLTKVKYLRLSKDRTHESWWIRMPFLPWRRAAAELERESIIEQLTARFPQRSIWLTDLAIDGAPRWEHLEKGDRLSRIEGLHYGAWAVFFSQRPITTEVSLPALRFDAVSALAQVHRQGAAASILSDVDDREWLLTFDQ